MNPFEFRATSVEIDRDVRVLGFGRDEDDVGIAVVATRGGHRGTGLHSRLT